MCSFSSDSPSKAIRNCFISFKNRSPRVSLIISACLSLICTLLLPAFLSDRSISFSNSFLSVAYAAILFMLFQRYLKQRHPKREIVLTHIFGFLLSCMTAMGCAIEKTGRFFPVSLVMCVSVLFYTHLSACAVSLLWAGLSRLEEKKATVRGQTDAPGAQFPRLRQWCLWTLAHPWVIALILLICWLPCYLSLFPGGFSYDMSNEFNQQFVTYKSDFPRLHSVLIIGFLNAAHHLFGSYNVGIALYAIAQMAAFSALFTHMLITFYRQRLRAGLISLFAAYFALFPVISLTVTHTGRDTLFAGLLTYLGFLLYELASDPKTFLSTVRKPAILGAVFSLTVMSRNNNSELIMLVLLAVINLIVWVRGRRLHARGVRIFCISNLTVFILLSFVLNLICQPITPTNPRASMSVISQTLCRAYIDEPEKWNEKDKTDFEYYVNMERFIYCAECADYSKNLLQNVKGAGNGIGFIKMWVRMGIKCPGSYLNAFLAQTRYMWYPDSLVDGYVKAGLYTSEKCYFVTGIEKPGKRISLWKAGEEFYRKICKDISFEKIPLLSMLFSIGFQYWLLLHCLFYSLYKRRKKLLLPLAVIFVYIAFCFFIPLVLLRYFMPLFLLFPLTVVMTIHQGAEEAIVLSGAEKTSHQNSADALFAKSTQEEEKQ